MTAFSIQVASAAHATAILALVPRLTTFGPPVWRSAPDIETKTREALTAWLNTPSGDAVILVAVDEAAQLLGFVHVEQECDFFAGTPRGYISAVAVMEAAQGRGVGRALLHAAEDWSQGRGFDYLALTVFAANRQARDVYASLGYQEDSLKLYKPLGGGPPAYDAEPDFTSHT